MQPVARSLKETLLGRGVGAEEILPVIFRNIYPWRQRVWWRLRSALNFDPFTAEWQLVEDLSLAGSVHDLEQCLFDYHCERPEYKALFMRPSRRRVRAFFHRVMRSDV